MLSGCFAGWILGMRSLAEQRTRELPAQSAVTRLTWQPWRTFVFHNVWSGHVPSWNELNELHNEFTKQGQCWFRQRLSIGIATWFVLITEFDFWQINYTSKAMRSLWRWEYLLLQGKFKWENNQPTPQYDAVHHKQGCSKTQQTAKFKMSEFIHHITALTVNRKK